MIGFFEFILSITISIIIMFAFIEIIANDKNGKKVGIILSLVALLVQGSFHGYCLWSDKREYDMMYERSVVTTDVYVYRIYDDKIELNKNGQMKTLKLFKNWRDGVNKPIVEMSSLDIKYDPDTNTLTKVLQVNVIRDEFLKESVQ